jgi:AcrR family transcriptional regulator
MARLTRAETQARNRRLLLRTARELFLRDGYQLTSIAAIAEEAGFSTGAVYSNFGTKAEMALHVLGEIQTERMDELHEILAEPFSADGTPARLRAWAESAIGSGWPRLELEFALEARADRELVAVEAARQRAIVDGIATAAEHQLRAAGLAGTLPARVFAEAAFNLAIGLAIRRMVDPKVSVNALLDLLAGLLTPADPSPPGAAAVSTGP